MLFHRVHDVIGHTPLVQLTIKAPAGTEVYAKLELANPFGMKDRVARTIIEEARVTGLLRPDAPIVESSSGTMALGVALVGRALGHPVHIVTDPRTDSTTLAKLRALGCEVHVVREMNAAGGWQAVRLDLLNTLLHDLPGAFWPQQYSNPDNPRAYHELAREIIQDLGPVDVLVGSVGSGGSLCGTTRALLWTCPGLRTVGVDCVGSALFDQPDVPTRLQSGLGNSLWPNNLDRRLIDEVHWLNDHEAFLATRALAAQQQIFAGNTSGSVYRVLGDVAARAEPGSRIVGIFPDRGDRYADTVYSDDHWDQHELSDLPVAETPAVVEYGTVVHQWSRAAVRRQPEQPGWLVFVEANTTGTGVTAIRATHRVGLRPVLITNDPSRYPGLGAAECEVVVCDTSSTLAVRAAIQDRLRCHDVAGITTTSDFYVPAVAELARWLDLPGNPSDAVNRCRDKTLLRAALERDGVHQPRFAVVTDAGQAPGAVGQVGLPCVVKPADDSGSNNVLLCRTVEQAVEHVTRVLAVRTNVRGLPMARRALVEEYLDGPEYSVEMFGVDGGMDLVGITAKTVTPGPFFVETRHQFPADLPTGLALEVEASVRTALKAVGMVFGATHTEVKLTATGPAVIEINPRLAGGMIPEVIRLATGTDLVEQQVRAAAALPIDVTPHHALHAGIEFVLAQHGGVFRGVDGVPAAAAVVGVERVTVTGVSGRRVRPARNAYDRLGHVIATGGSAGDVRQALADAVAALRVHVDEPDRGADV